MFDVAIVGAGVLGASLACEARALGLAVVVVAPNRSSPSFTAARWFRLNTWTGRGQHGELDGTLKRADGARFPVAEHLPRVTAAALKAARVPFIRGEVQRVRFASGRVTLTGTHAPVHARAAVLALGWGPAKGLPRGAWDFSSALRRLASGAPLRGTIAVVGGGPSALSFLEACVGLAPNGCPSLKSDQSLLWFRGETPSTQRPAVKAMFDARYAPLSRALRKHRGLVTLARRVTSASRHRARWRLVDVQGDLQLADELVWCAGFEAPLELINHGATRVRPLRRAGVKLAMQRVGPRGPEPIFQLGPALDQLGYASWDVGPYAEWFEKGRRLLVGLATARTRSAP